MTLIAPADVCRRIELYYAGEALRFPGPQATPQLNPATAGAEAAMPGHTEVNGYANRHAEAMSSRLVVDGAPTPLGADYVLRWVDQPDGPAQAVLHHHGKRITRSWSLDLSCHSPPDAHGGNANTE